jgi:very-short-patch-repair endonuclease
MVDPFASSPVCTTAQLEAAGWSERRRAALVRSGHILRVRRGYYALPGTSLPVLQAIRMGGRLGCITAARELGVWSAESTATHIALDPHASRIRWGGPPSVVHWSEVVAASSGTIHSVGIVDALVQTVRCQPGNLAVASIDSALNLGLIDERDVALVAAAVPQSLRTLVARSDGRSMSGLETIVRLLAQDAGLQVEPQVRFVGIGVVDLVIEACVVVETDGRDFHETTEYQRRDFARDAALVRRGYTVLRFNYRQVVHEPEGVLATIVGALRAHRAARHLG